MSIKLQLPKVTDLRPRLTVIGVGGAGGNAVNNMIAAGLSGVDFVVANTDAQALQASSAEHQIQLGANLTEGLGAGSRPEIGEAAAEEAIEDIRSRIAGAHMVFVAAGMGGGTGTGAASVIARVAKDEGVLVVGIVTKPFQFEGARRQRVAEAGIAELKKYVDTLIVIPNQNLFRIANEKTTFAEAFVLADQVLYSGISCIVDLIVKEGLINLDFADVRTILSGMGTAMMGTGEASGERRAILAAEEAIANPLLDEVSLRGARGLLLSIIGGRNLTLYEVDEAASRVRQEVDAEANIIVGATFDESLGDRVRVSIVASGMDRVEALAAQMQAAGRLSAAAAVQPAGQMRQAPQSAQQQASAQQSFAASRARQDVEADELRHRLSEAMSGHDPSDPGDDEAIYDPQPDPSATIAGAPWRAPGDVYIEEGPPQLMAGAPLIPQQSAGSGAPAHQPPATFTPSPPNEIRRPQSRRMPELEDFPAVGQRDYRAKAQPAAQPQRVAPAPAPRGPVNQAVEERRRPGLLERLTGRGRRPSDSGESQRVSPPQAHVRAPAAAPQRPAAAARPPSPAPEPTSHRRAAVGDQGVELPMFYNRDGK